MCKKKKGNDVFTMWTSDIMGCSTEHAIKRSNRFRLAKHTLGFGTVWCKKEIDEGELEGPKLYLFTTTGLIFVGNAWTKKLITLKIARPQQVLSYFTGEEYLVPAKVLEVCARNEAMGYNNR